MDVAGEYTFDAPQQIVWEALRDPDVLGSILPGGEGTKEIGENEYESKLKIKVGPVQGRFKGKIKLENINPPTSYDIIVNGRGAPGFVKGSGALTLSAADDNKTHMVYSGKAQVGGRIASVGQRLLDASSKSIIRQSLDALNAYCVAQVDDVEEATVDEPVESVVASAEEIVEESAETVIEQIEASVEEVSTPPSAAAPRPKVELHNYTPPTQTELALNVAKDVLDDLVPERWQPIVVAALTSFLTTLLLNLFGRK